MTVNQRVKLIYESLQITQYKFAKITGISAATLNNIIQDISFPSYKVLLQILECYKNLDARWLMTGEGDMWKTEDIDFKEIIVSEPPPQYESTKELPAPPLEGDDIILKKEVELLSLEVKRLNMKFELMERALEKLKKAK